MKKAHLHHGKTQVKAPSHLNLALLVALMMSLMGGAHAMEGSSVGAELSATAPLSVEELVSQFCQGRNRRLLESDSYTEISQTTLKNELEQRGLTPSKQCLGSHELNFGVLVNNPYFKIYRSSGLGTRGLLQLEQHLQGERHPERLPATIIYMNHYAYGGASEKIKNYFIRKYKAWEGSSTLPYYSFADQQDRNPVFPLSGKGFKFLHPAGDASRNVYLHGRDPLHDILEDKDFTEKAKDRSDRDVPIKTRGGRENLYNVIENILAGEGPVLFHCKGGIHRTGMTGLMVRYLQGGDWTRPWFAGGGDAGIPVRVKTGGTEFSLARVKNPAEYEYFLHNPNNFRQENLKAIRELASDFRFQCLKDKFAAYLNLGDKSPDNKCSLDNPVMAPVAKNGGEAPLLSPEEFHAFAVKAVEECRSIHRWESKVESELDYLESVVSLPHRKIRMVDGLFKDAVTGLPAHGKNESREEHLQETAARLQRIPEMIDLYRAYLENGNKDGAKISLPEAGQIKQKLLELQNRYQKLLLHIRKKDPSLGAYLPAS